MTGFVDSLVVTVVSASSIDGTRLKFGDVEESFGEGEIEKAGLVAPACVRLGVEALAVAIAFVRGRPLGRALLYTHCDP